MSRTAILIFLAMLGIGAVLAVSMWKVTRATLRLLAAAGCTLASGVLLVWLACTGAPVATVCTGVLIVIACALSAGACLIAYGNAIDENNWQVTRAREHAQAAERQLTPRRRRTGATR